VALFQQHRYSGLIRPISYIADLAYINTLAVFCFFNGALAPNFLFSISIGWTITALISRFYEVYRYSFITRVFNLLSRQLLFFTLIVFAYSGFHTSLNLTPISIIKYIGLSFLFVSFSKYGMFFLLKKYRGNYKLNNRNTVILGANRQGSLLEDFFEATPHLGFQNKKTFSVKELSKHELESIFSYILNNKIDEIYCSTSELNNRDLLSIVNFADNNLKVVKFIPESTQVLSKKLKHDFYGVIPILSFRTIALNDPFNLFLKRAFDVVFSLMVIVFILSWLTPILAILISLESKGPVFFTQLRNGHNYNSFKCFKFRSMIINPAADLIQVSRDDDRITTVGKFLRKTSIDEIPQFFNVFLGQMSVVGPRPHMLSHTEIYAKSINKFMVRHFVKPGITGLAQVSGFRGEIETEKDIIGRVKHDIFYIENWSFFLDTKIIVQTILNFLKGEEKAY
jgi:putative colanic acid biosynthesis UDP-glucose lipid carrier transferase